MSNQIQERTAQSGNLNSFDAISIRLLRQNILRNGQKIQRATNGPVGAPQVTAHVVKYGNLKRLTIAHFVPNEMACSVRRFLDRKKTGSVDAVSTNGLNIKA